MAIVQNMKSGRTETTGLIRNIIAIAGEDVLVKSSDNQELSRSFNAVFVFR